MFEKKTVTISQSYKALCICIMKLKNLNDLILYCKLTEMPLSLFGNKFSPKKTPPRRSHSLSNLHLDATQTREEFGPDVGPVKLKLGGSEIQFDNGMWVAGMKFFFFWCSKFSTSKFTKPLTYCT